MLRRERIAATQIVPGLYVISPGPVNAFLLESSEGCTLIDTGLLGSADKILQQLGTLASNRVTCFGHGKAILHDAVGKFKEKWA